MINKDIFEILDQGNDKFAVYSNLQKRTLFTDLDKDTAQDLADKMNLEFTPVNAALNTHDRSE